MERKDKKGMDEYNILVNKIKNHVTIKLSTFLNYCRPLSRLTVLTMTKYADKKFFFVMAGLNDCRLFVNLPFALALYTFTYVLHVCIHITF